jgi:hypothetical protein
MYPCQGNADPFSAGSPAVREGAAERLLLALSEPRAPGARPSRRARSAPSSESDAAYFRRRSKEELAAADKAASPEARRAHSELARRYARLSPSLSAALQQRSAEGRDEDRKRRQSKLLDDALMATFPASDPVSVAFVG